MTTTDFEQDDGLEELTSEELEEQAFGPDPDRKRKRSRRSRRSRKKKKEKEARALPVPVSAPPALAAVATKFCYACGAELDGRAEVCPYCGVGQPLGPFLPGGRRAPGEKSKGGATLLALVLGSVGAHRFYLGQPKVGLAMLLFWWTLIPWVVGFVDFVRLAFMTDREFARRYGRQSPVLTPHRPVRRLERAVAAKPTDVEVADVPAGA